MPEPAEIDLLVLELDDRRDLREAVEPLHERVIDRLAEAAGRMQKLLRRQRLAAKEHHAVFEPGSADGCDGRVTEILRKIDAEDLGAERARERANVERVGFHRAAPAARQFYRARRTVTRRLSRKSGPPDATSHDAPACARPRPHVRFRRGS